MHASRPRNILIVRLSAIGDVVHTLPCLHALRVAFPEARIGWVVEELSAPLLEGHPELDDLFIIPKKRWRRQPLRAFWSGEKRRFYAGIRKVKWEVALDFQGLSKSGWAAWKSGAPTRIGHGGADAREINALFTNRRVRASAGAPHVIQRNLALLEPLGVRVADSEIAWRFPDFSAERESLRGFFETIGIARSRRYMALCPGAGWMTKRWSPQYFAELARALQNRSEGAERLPIVVIWGPGEETLCRDILDSAGLPPEQLVLAPRTNLRELAALLEEASVFVGGDTGPTHLAAALGVPVVGIYGGSDPVRNGPWGKEHIVLHADRPSCVPCWRTDCNHTPLLECLALVTPPSVADAVEKILNRR